MNSEIERIQTLSTLFGPSGMEDKVSAYAIEQTKSFCDARTDSMRNTILIPRSQKDHDTTILLDAHSDEVGFIIQAIKPNGTLRFLPLGGWDPKNVIGSQVWIQNTEGVLIDGIVASQPVHFLSASQKSNAIDFDQLVIDIGACSQEEVQNDYKIEIGAFACPAITCSYHEKQQIFMGKAFDCRIGCAALLETLSILQTKELDHSIIGLLSSQEEVGERGASLAIHQIQPDLAICFEGCPADDTFEESYMIQSGLKRGPMLRHFDRSMITNPRYMSYCIQLAKEKNIPIQTSVRKGGGTNGGIYHCANQGIPTIIIGIPVRFAHAPCGICSYQDYKNAVSLAVSIIENITKETIQSF